MTYPEEVATLAERERILKIVDTLIDAENSIYEMASSPEMIGICGAIHALKNVKQLINAV